MTRPVEEDVHFRVLRILEQDPEISQRELAAKLGIALGRTNYVLNALLEKGLIKLGKFSAARDKRRYAYVLTPKGMARKAAITRRFLARKITEYEALKAEIETLQDELHETSNVEGHSHETDSVRAMKIRRNRQRRICRISPCKGAFGRRVRGARV